MFDERGHPSPGATHTRLVQLPFDTPTCVADLDMSGRAILKLNVHNRSVRVAAPRLREAEVLSISISDARVSPFSKVLLAVG